MKKVLKQANDFIYAYPMVAIGIVCALFGAIWYFFLRKKSPPVTVPVNESNLTKPLAVYEVIADTLEDCFGINDDEEKMFSELRGLNPDELKAVYNAFGKREMFWTNDISAPSGKQTLISLFKAKLNEAEQERMREVWASTGLW